MKLLLSPVLFVAAGTSCASAQECDSWVHRFPEHAPSNIGFQTMAYDSARGQSVVFDGNPDIDVAETWTWDGTDWTLRSAIGPDSVEYHAMAFDLDRGVTVLYGGMSRQGEILEDLWLWNGTAWQPYGAGPGPRATHAMAYDPDRHVMVVFGGVDEDSHDLGDLWESGDGGLEWTKRPAPGPSAGFPVMAYDSDRRVMVLLIDPDNQPKQTWEWDGKTWTLVIKEGPLAWASMVYDADLHACITYGGSYDQSGQQTWRWDGQTWTKLNTPVKPPPCPSAPMAYDSARHAIVLLTPGAKGQTWEFTCTPPCYPDLDANGSLDLFDFLTFVNLFNSANPEADCDYSGSLNLFDFLCFTNAFNAGC